MDTFAASNAISEPGRVWPQHQASLTLLDEMVSNPANASVKWLDLACGEGQILTSLAQGFDEDVRGKIEYTGFDRMDAYLRSTEKIASSIGLGGYKTQVGNLSVLTQIFSQERFDFITLINVVHELDPRHLAAVLVDATLRLSSRGALYVYDMELIEPEELGAIAWRAGEFKAIVASMFEALGAGDYRPNVARWSHKTRNGWSLTVRREHIADTSGFEAMRPEAEAATKAKVYELIEQKITACKGALEQLTTFGAETAEEQDTAKNLLYDFWALKRVLEAR